MRISRWIIVAIVAVAFATFAVANRAAVELSLWPLPFVIGTRLFIVGLGGVALGFLGGLAVAWIAARPWRRRAREGRRRVQALEAELNQTRATGARPPSTAAAIATQPAQPPV